MLICVEARAWPYRAGAVCGWAGFALCNGGGPRMDHAPLARFHWQTLLTDLNLPTDRTAAQLKKYLTYRVVLILKVFFQL